MRDQLYQDAVVTAFNYGRESVLVEIIDGEIIEIASIEGEKK